MKDLSSAKQCKLQLLYVGYWDKKICLQQSSASPQTIKISKCSKLFLHRTSAASRAMTFGNGTSTMKIEIGSPQPKVTLMS
jgi:hypothetical protein